MEDVEDTIETAVGCSAFVVFLVAELFSPCCMKLLIILLLFLAFCWVVS